MPYWRERSARMQRARESGSADFAPTIHKKFSRVNSNQIAANDSLAEFC
jgi:hypothetical protein